MLSTCALFERHAVMMSAASAASRRPTSICVVGAQGRLGRELVQQSLDREWHPTGLVRRPHDPVPPPDRRGWLTPNLLARDATAEALEVPLVETRGRDTRCPPHADAVVFALSGLPFEEEDRTSEIVRAVCDTLPPSCRKVCLVSAHGVGDSIDGADPGIRAMRSWYLKTTYCAKEEQEYIVRALDRDVLILRPRVLSFQTVPLNPIARTRYDLAREILDWCDDE